MTAAGTVYGNVAGDVSDRHLAQISCCKSANNSAETVLQITVPANHVTASSSRHSQFKNCGDVSASRNICTTGRYCIETHIHRLSVGQRAAEYYLYTLCRLRI